LEDLARAGWQFNKLPKRQTACRPVICETASWDCQ
jgi:hypothetical protein